MVLSAAAAEGAEGDRLSVTPNRVLLRAAAEPGLFYGGVTFRQLLPPEVFSTNRPAHPTAE